VETAAPLPNPLAMGMVEWTVIVKSAGGNSVLQRQMHDRGEGIDRVGGINRERSIDIRRVNDQAVLARLDRCRGLHLRHRHSDGRRP